MPSAITSVIGGFVGSGAAKHAADSVVNGYAQAGQTMSTARDSANSTISGAVNSVAPNIINASDAVSDRAQTIAGQGAKNITDAASAGAAGLQPYTTTGAAATGKAATIADSMTNPYTADQMMQEDPGYAFRLQQSTEALKRSQAATGSVTGGAGAKALASFTQDDASNEYANAFQRHLATQQAAFQDQKSLADSGQQASEFGANLTTGAATTGANLKQQATEYGGNTEMQGAEFAGGAQLSGANAEAGNDINTGQYVANGQIGAGNARAAGTMGAAKSWNNMLSGIGNTADAFAGGFAGGGWTGGLEAAGGIPPGFTLGNAGPSPTPWPNYSSPTYNWNAPTIPLNSIGSVPGIPGGGF